MTFQPNNITREHVLNAVSKIALEQIELIPSTRWLVIVDGKTYPPKEVMRYAHEQMNAERIWELSGGKNTNNILTKLGFEITTANLNTDPLKNIVDTYKKRIHELGMADELYKWKLLGQFKGRPDTNVTDFAKEVEGIKFANLIYHNGITVINQIAKLSPEGCRDCFKVLFDETKQLSERVKYFNEETLKIYREVLKENEFPHHQDERTISTYLTYHNPDKYTFYKDSFYVKLCKLLNIKHKKKGDKYVHYMDIIDNLIETYINDDEELIHLIQQQNDDSLFADTAHKILVQDILYQTLEKQEFNERSYWRIGTSSSDGKEKVWDYMLSNNKICIAWGEIGDLNEAEIKSRNDIMALLRKEGTYDEKNQSLISRKAGEIYEFYSNIKIGDIVLAQDGEQILGIGIITDEYSFDGSKSFAHQKDVEWICKSPELKNKEGNQTTIWKLENPELKKQVYSLLQKGYSMNNDKSLNQILYGPPGTGKTYNTIDKALEIIGVSTEGKTRKEIKEVFDAKMQEGQIIFTTFHQSMSYEDFIEGIKPVEPKIEGQPVIYKIIDGIFKKACAIAAYNSYTLFLKNREQQTSYTFDDLYNGFISSIKDRLDQNIPVLYRTLSGKETQVYEVNNKKGIEARAKDSVQNSSTPCNKENIQKLYDKFERIEDIKDLSQIIKTIGVKWRVREYSALFRGLKEFEKGFISETKAIEWTETLDINEVQKKFNVGVYNDAIKIHGIVAEPIVIIIDEINRGNVSQIFGELITLIEDDKRLGMPESLEITLPYSKEKFGVPPNLYIIGTMNTADRSVEALDAALRRRFSFVEMAPEPELIAKEGALKDNGGIIEGISMPNLLTIINKRIEKLLDKDHQIGHSYFMTVSKLQDLKIVFQYKIIPLLQEYFFGDYGKIGLVLGDDFVEAEKKSVGDIFASFEGDQGSEYEDRITYKIKDISELTAADFVKVYSPKTKSEA